MPSPYADILRKHFRPLEPIPTGEKPVLRWLPGIRAVLFDVYGTLFISGSGEVGTTGQATCEAAMAGAFCGLGLDAPGAVGQAVEILLQRIEASHAESRKTGIEYPEVDILKIWGQVLAELARRGLIDEGASRSADPKRLAVEYEARANPCWPMPDLPECLEGLRLGGLVLGLVSNAQFYTPELFQALLGRPAEDLGFARELQYYSYEHGRAKPALDLHEMAAQALSRRGVEPAAVLFVGNDMLGDVLPALTVGFRTALFAGDARSLRLHKGDSRLDGVSSDIVLTCLLELNECLSTALD